MNRLFIKSNPSASVSRTGAYVFACFVLLSFTACTGSSEEEPEQPKISFDKTKWNLKEDKNYTYRKMMVNDVLDNYTWAGVKKDSVIGMLGKPDAVEEGALMYNYHQEPFLGGLGTSIESIVFEMNGDSTVKRARFSDGGWD